MPGELGRKSIPRDRGRSCHSSVHQYPQSHQSNWGFGGAGSPNGVWGRALRHGWIVEIPHAARGSASANEENSG